MGAPRVHGQLCRVGTRVGCKRVVRLMAELDLVGVRSRKKWRRDRLDAAPAPDLLQRDFSARRPNERWVADITEFLTGEGKLFLSGVKDFYGRGLVGWSMGTRQTSELVIEAVSMAVARRNPVIPPLHHSDKGCQYTSLDFTNPAPRARPRPLLRIHRGLLRLWPQRGHGDLLGHAQARAELDPRAFALHEPSAITQRPLRLHRDLLQPRTGPSRTRSSQPV
jgi:transposase InsO family protein